MFFPWQVLNTSPFPQGGHCHLNRRATSPTFPLRYLRLSLPTLPPLSMTFLADIYWGTFADLSLGGSVLLFRQYMRIIRELNSPTATTIFSKGAISHLSTSAPLSPSSPPSPPALFSSTPLHTPFIF